MGVHAQLSDVSIGMIGTHAQIKALVTDGTLRPGAYYTITDFQTIHIIPNTNALCVQGTVYEIKGNWTNTLVEGVEPLTIRATSVNSFDLIATSSTNPSDIIYYDFTKYLCEDGATTRKGQITYRRNTVYNIEAYFDWMNHRFRRWKINPNVYNAATTYAVNDVVLFNNTVWVCIAAGTVGVDPGSDKKKWMGIYDILGFSAYGILTYWVATTPTNFKIANWTVPVDAADFNDFLAISRASGPADGKSHSLILSQGVLNNITIGKCSTDPNLYNNIVICIGNTLYGFSCKNVRFAANCKNMTFSFSMEDSTFYAAAYDNLFRYATIACQFFGPTFSNVTLYNMQKVVAMSEFMNNVIAGAGYCFFGRFVYACNFSGGINNFVCTNEVQEARFSGAVSRLDAIYIYKSTFWGALDDIKFAVSVRNKTIDGTYSGYNRVVNMISPDGSLWASSIDDTGHLSPEKII